MLIITASGPKTKNPPLHPASTAFISSVITELAVCRTGHSNVSQPDCNRMLSANGKAQSHLLKKSILGIKFDAALCANTLRGFDTAQIATGLDPTSLEQFNTPDEHDHVFNVLHRELRGKPLNDYLLHARADELKRWMDDNVDQVLHHLEHKIEKSESKKPLNVFICGHGTVIEMFLWSLCEWMEDKVLARSIKLLASNTQLQHGSAFMLDFRRKRPCTTPVCRVVNPSKSA